MKEIKNYKIMDFDKVQRDGSCVSKTAFKKFPEILEINVGFDKNHSIGFVKNFRKIGKELVCDAWIEEGAFKKCEKSHYLAAGFTLNSEDMIRYKELDVRLVKNAKMIAVGLTHTPLDLDLKTLHEHLKEEKKNE
jgi:hypothetical protein